MLKRISGELAIDIDKIEFMEKDGDFWNITISERRYKIKNFEAIRIFELLGEKVTLDDRFPKECNCG